MKQENKYRYVNRILLWRGNPIAESINRTPFSFYREEAFHEGENHNEYAAENLLNKENEIENNLNHINIEHVRNM